MIITPVKTTPLSPQQAPPTLAELCGKFLPSLSEESIVVVTSKVAAICEGAVIPHNQIDKKSLIRQECEYFLPASNSKYKITLTIKHGTLIPTAGIDESNGDGYYILWPAEPQKTANALRRLLQQKHNLKCVGVIVTDSKSSPLRRGTTGIAIAHSGFLALNNYVGQRDIFGQPLRVTQANIADGLAAAAVVAMGEGAEQTPLAVVQDVPFVTFQPRNPYRHELDALRIAMEDDLYAALLTSQPWQPGSQGEITSP